MAISDTTKELLASGEATLATNMTPISDAYSIYMIFFPLLAYLIGSIPFGLILSKLFGHGDIRKIGSGNIGATNVLRAGNKKLAALTLLLDATKASAIILISYQYLFGNKYFGTLELELLIIGFFAILGHCFPVWLKFRGGKGVATALGVLLAAVPMTGLAACATWLMIAFGTKISSLAALVALAVAPIVTFFIYGGAPAAICALITALVWLRHKDNIKRLLKGEEPKIGNKKKGEKQDDAATKQP